MQNQAHEGVHLIQKAILAKMQKREKIQMEDYCDAQIYCNLLICVGLTHTSQLHN
jgi:hypothetical protein